MLVYSDVISTSWLHIFHVVISFKLCLTIIIGFRYYAKSKVGYGVVYYMKSTNSDFLNVASLTKE